MTFDPIPRILRGRSKREREPDRPDRSEPESKVSWATKLDAYVPTAAAPSARVVVAPEPVAVKQPSIGDALEGLMTTDGAMCVALVDGESGMVLGQVGSGIDMDLAAAGATEVIRAKRDMVKALKLPDAIDDVLITLTEHHLIIRPLAQKPTMFLYMIVDKSKSNLAMARYKVTEAEALITL